MFNAIKNATLAIGYGIYLTINSSKEQKQALKAELAAKRQPAPAPEAIAPEPALAPTPTPAPVVEDEWAAPAPTPAPVVEDEWAAPAPTSKKPYWTTTGIVHTIATQLALPPAQEVAEQPTIDYYTWTVAALRDVAKARGIRKYYNMKKAELIEMLTK